VALTPIAEYRAKRKAESKLQAKEKVQKGELRWIQATIISDQSKRIKLSATVQTSKPFPDYIEQSNKRPKSKLDSTVGTFKVVHLPPIPDNPAKKDVIINQILPQIYKQSGVESGTKAWCFIVCDGGEAPILCFSSRGGS